MFQVTSAVLLSVTMGSSCARKATLAWTTAFSATATTSASTSLMRADVRSTISFKFKNRNESKYEISGIPGGHLKFQGSFESSGFT